jgi:hypothetical protein
MTAAMSPDRDEMIVGELLAEGSQSEGREVVRWYAYRDQDGLEGLIGLDDMEPVQLEVDVRVTSPKSGGPGRLSIKVLRWVRPGVSDSPESPF